MGTKRDKSMRTLRFGIEIETVGQTRNKIARAVQGVVGGTVSYLGSPHSCDPWAVTDRRGRTWKVMADSSLSAPRHLQAEVVSPILHYDDIEELQQVVRAVRKARAKVDQTTAIHIHVDAARFDARKAANLIKIVNKQEQLIEHALGVNGSRRNHWCRGIDQDFVALLEQRRPRTMEQLNQLWYGYRNTHPTHYDRTRYRGVNLHNLWYRGTIEFRWFDATLHAGEVKAYLQFVLALCAKALRARAASSRKRDFNPETAKYDFRVFLLSLGLIGDEFKTARIHLMAHLKGSAAWKNGRPEHRSPARAPAGDHALPVAAAAGAY